MVPLSLLGSLTLRYKPWSITVIFVDLAVFQHLGGSYDLNVRFRNMGCNHSRARTNPPGSGWALVGQPGDEVVQEERG